MFFVFLRGLLAGEAMSIAQRLRAPSYAVVLSFAVFACSPHSAAQTTGTPLIPGPPFVNTPGIGSHQADQNPETPQYAHDAQTDQSLKWDPVKKSWIDQKTGEALGFDGKIASDGAIIPAPPINLIDTGDGAKWQHLADQDADNPETARGKTHTYKGELAEPGGIAFHWDRAKQSWVDNDTGDAIGLSGFISSAPQEQAGPTPSVPACPTQADCDHLRELYLIADKASVAAGQALIQARADRESDLAQAAQLDKLASHRGDSDVSKAEQQQAQALRDNLPNAESNYNLAYKATIAAYDAWEDCLKRLKDCPPKAAAQSANGTGTTNNPPATTGGNSTTGDNTSGGTNTPPGLIGNGPWIVVFPGLPPWNLEEHRWLGYNSDHTRRPDENPFGEPEVSKSADEWIVFFPGVLYNSRTKLFHSYGYDMDGNLVVSEGHDFSEPENPPSGAGNSQPGPGNSQPGGSSESGNGGAQTGETPAGPVGAAPTTPAVKCTASTPTVQATGVVDVSLDCTGTPAKDSSIRVRSSQPFTMADVEIKFTDSGPRMMISGTLRNDDHVTRFDLPERPDYGSAFKMNVGLKWDIKAQYDHVDFRFRGSPGIDITPRGFTAPIKDNQFGGFTPVDRFVDPARYMWEHNRWPADCYDTTTTPYVPLLSGIGQSTVGTQAGNSQFIGNQGRNIYKNFNDRSAWSMSGLDYFPRCTLNYEQGSLTLGGMIREGWRGASGLDTSAPAGTYNGGFEWRPNLDTGGNYLNGGWSSREEPHVTLPYVYVRPRSYYDDNGPQPRFVFLDPWGKMPYFCDYDFPDKLRAFPELAMALAAEARSGHAPESRASMSEPGNARFQLVSLRRASSISELPNRAARPAQGDKRPPQVQIEARTIEIAPAFKYSIEATGKFQEFKIHVADTTGKVKTVAIRDGTVVEAIKPGVAQPVAESAGDAVAQGDATAYCLEFKKPAPAEGTLYRIADQPTQQKYASLRYVDMAAAQMSQKNEFHPDSNLDTYKRAILQYTIWSIIEGWDQSTFTKAWVERVKQNAEDLHVKWTKAMEDQLVAAAPGRWADISEVRNQAQSLEKASQDRRDARRLRRQTQQQ